MSLIRIIVLGYILFYRPIAFAQDACGSLTNPFGPFDYRTVSERNRLNVERAHFTADVVALRRGSTGSLGHDISYTLRAMPNHPMALRAMMLLGQREKTEKPRGADYTVSCFFIRAIRFQPDDPTPRFLYALALHKRGAKAEALEHLDVAKEYSDGKPALLYNVGLIYADLGLYDKALECAHQAYAGGVTYPGLRRKIEKAGKWKDP